MIPLIALLLLAAAEPKPLITTPGKQILSEDFSAPAIPATWKPGGRPNSFSIVDGALRGVSAPDDHHGPAISVDLTAHDLTVAFDMKFVSPKGLLLVLINGESAFGGDAHLLRLAVQPTGMTLQQDRGSPKSHLDQGKEKTKADKEGRKLPPPTPEQLNDPAFYRTEKLGGHPGKFTDGQWHHVLIEVRGNDFAAQIDGDIAVTAKATVADVAKSKLVFLVGLQGTIDVDNVRVWENQPK